MSNEAPNKGNQADSGDERHNPGSAPAPAKSPPSDSADNDSQPKKGFCERWRHEVEFVAVVAAVFYAIFTYKEWRTFDSERVIMETEFKMAQTNATREANAAEKQLLEIQKEHRLDERAWVLVVRTEKAAGLAANTWKEIVVVKNLGRTPARHLNGFVAWGFYPVPVNMAAVSNFIYQGEAIPNTEDDTIVQDGFRSFETHDIPTFYLDEVKSNIQTLVLYGAFKYDDVFSQHHFNRFCFAMGSNIDVGYTLPFHNESDDDDHH